MIRRLHTSLLILLLLCVAPSSAVAEIVSLDGVFRLAQERSEALQSARYAIMALEREISSRDLELSPVLIGEAAAVRDERERVNDSSENTNNVTSTRGRYGLLDFTLVKPFETGTEVSLSAGNTIRNRGASDRDRTVADWELRVSQALWRNRFGRAVDLRHQAESFELRRRRLEILGEQQRILKDIESSYWDLALATRELEIRTSNFNRSVALERWMRDRVERFAAEHADLLQVQTLLSERQLDLTIAKNALEAARNRLRQLVPGIDSMGWEIETALLDRSRTIDSLLLESQDAPAQSGPTRIDALAANYAAEESRIQEVRIEDSLKPALDAYAAYGANGLDDSWGSAWASSARDDSNIAQVGVLFSVELDAVHKHDRREAARLRADADALRWQALERDSTIGWKELARNAESVKRQIAQAGVLARLQRQKVEAERERFEQGRSTTFQLTTFEVDASESELRLYRLLAALRKIENEARLYVRSEAVPS